jgi:hypothetical protein
MYRSVWSVFRFPEASTRFQIERCSGSIGMLRDPNVFTTHIFPLF